ncbi:DUF3788 domain-containing protein [Congzhengia minquanensis]|uniref:DUF3788 domain-containing protein n=1 Tax=Congzhengia minquanensis TaxID=2763657 RepID=A0A926HZ76_9FIRM|nr:DUF3788 domain-containing protein [Congzhengia minquanensis]MBC8541864.1 DUF3788 domain-containing protein [Congzhengia minquanensis]
MTWSEKYTQEFQPDLNAVAEYINSPLWTELLRFMEETYGVTPKIEYSKCSGAPGWNVKLKKGGRALCTLYPEKDVFTCLICIGRREVAEAELVLSSHEALRVLYENTKPFNGARWLMIAVTDGDVLNVVKKLITIRACVKK